MQIPLPSLPIAVLESTSPRIGAGPDLSRYALLCGLLVALTIGAAWLFKRIALRTVASRAAKRSLRVVDVLPLGGRQKLAVVRCYDRTFLLGMGEKEISALAELDPAIGGEPARATSEPADREAFARALEAVRRSLDAGRRRPAPEPPLPARPASQGGTASPAASPGNTVGHREAAGAASAPAGGSRPAPARLEGIVA